MIVFRHADPRFPFLWERPEQPPGRWNAAGEGPVHYLADTPNAAWAELLRHEEITEAEDLAGVRRSLWAIELAEAPAAAPELPPAVPHGPPASYPRCRRESARLRAAGAEGLRAPSAALLPGGGTGQRVDGGLRPGPERDGTVFVLFGRRPDLVGWRAVEAGGRGRSCWSGCGSSEPRIGQDGQRHRPPGARCGLLASALPTRQGTKRSLR